MNRKNRAFWDSSSDRYQATHGPRLREPALAWGVWRIPESKLGVLDHVDGRDVLELGCGAAQWTLALTRLGAHAVGIDLSLKQLGHARLLAESEGVAAPLVQCDAEALPFKGRAFDIVFSDHGAIVYASPEKTVAEAARVLRPNGLIALCMSTPIHDICFDQAAEAVTSQLVADYFTLSKIEDGQSVEYQRPYGEWIRLFRAHGLVVEDLIELQAPADGTTTYADFVSADWAFRWPSEHIWKLRKVT